jgi:hypothetical protein
MRRNMKGVIILHSLNKYFIQWGHNEKRYDRCHHTPFDDTFHISAHCDLTVWSIYWVNGVWWHLSYLFSLWPHCMKYLLSEWSMMTPFISLLIVTSLSEVFIEWMEYDVTFHTSAHCDLTVLSIYWVNGVNSINTSDSEVTMSRGMKGVTILHSLNKYFIQWGQNEQRYERCHHTPFTQ